MVLMRLSRKVIAKNVQRWLQRATLWGYVISVVTAPRFAASVRLT
jgi:hypothetical protein